MALSNLYDRNKQSVKKFYECDQCCKHCCIFAENNYFAIFYQIVWISAKYF